MKLARLQAMNLRELRDGETQQERYREIKEIFMGRYSEKYLEGLSLVKPSFFSFHDVILCWVHGSLDLKKIMDLEENKGLFLMGGVRTGKTTSLEVLRSLGWLPCRSVGCKMLSSRASVEGLAFVEGFREQRKGSGELRFNDWLFDDLGSEDRLVQSFGTVIRPLEEIITMRYEQYQRFGMFSHFTSNLKPEQIREFYGERIYSRLAGMCNVVVVKGVSDMRKSVNSEQ